MNPTVTPSSTMTLARRGGLDVLELPTLEVRLTRADGGIQRCELGLAPLVVGSGAGSDLVVNDPRISRQHCQLQRTDRGISVKDLDSKNGTFCNGVRVLEVLVGPDMPLRLGSAELMVTAQPSKLVQLTLSQSPQFGGALGASLPMRALFSRLERAATSNEAVLLLGESGTGKELLARALHDSGERRTGPWVVVDCGSIASSLIESQLFGHRKGAFSGATDDHTGLFVEANGGTLLLDNVNELPLELQSRLLRAIDRGEVRPLGADQPIRVDVRVIASAPKALRERANAGQFRSDLYFRLAVVEAEIPPLRQRRDDIPLLAEHFLKQLDPPRGLEALAPGTLDMLMGHQWPGNVRELHNAVVRLALFPDLGRDALLASSVSNEAGLEGLPLSEARELAVRRFERDYLRTRLAEAKGNVIAAAKAMGVTRQLVYKLIERYRDDGL